MPDNKIIKRVGKAAIVVVAFFALVAWGPMPSQCAPPQSPYAGITEVNQIGAYLRSATVYAPGTWGGAPGDTRYYTSYIGGRADGSHMTYDQCVTWMKADGNIRLAYHTAAEDACSTYRAWDYGSAGYWSP